MSRSTTFFAVEVAAAFGVELVLDVQPGQAGVFDFLDGAGHVHRFAEAGVGVHDGREVRHAGDLPGTGGNFGEGGQADVGQAEVVGQDRAGYVNPREPFLFDEPGREGVERARELGDGAGGEQFAEPDPLLLGRDFRIQH
ncbi:hypothetical protein QF047_002305 [Arthrobacter sp. W4I7]|nr:hypothetical protein [Arthrobacter sp. W4I7]